MNKNKKETEDPYYIYIDALALALRGNFSKALDRIENGIKILEKQNNEWNRGLLIKSKVLKARLIIKIKRYYQ